MVILCFFRLLFFSEATLELKRATKGVLSQGKNVKNA